MTRSVPSKKSKSRVPSTQDNKRKERKGLRVTLADTLVVVILIGVLLRIYTYWSGYMFWDAPYYIQMGKSFAAGQNFILPYGEPFSPVYIHTSEPSHHFSPMYPMYLGIFFGMFGFSYELARVLSILASLLLILTIYFTSQNLFGKERALIVTALVSVDPNIMMTTRDLMPENLVLMFFALTIWAIIRALKDDRFMLLAALFAGAGYLTKSSTGYLFIIAGVGGFTWRFLYLRWTVFKRKYYMVAIAIFLGIVGLWAWRNISTFGWPNWETSPYLQRALAYPLTHVIDFIAALVITTVFSFVILMGYCSYWLPWLRKSLARIKKEDTSALWLATGLGFIMTVWFSACLTIFEHSDLVTQVATRIRYLIISVPTLLWAIVAVVPAKRIQRPLGLRSIKGFFAELGRGITGLRKKKKKALVIALILVSAISIATIHTAIEFSEQYVFLKVTVMLVGGALALLFVDFRKVLVVMIAFFMVLSVEMATEQVHTPDVELSIYLNDHVAPGENVSLDGPMINSGYFYIGLDNIDFNLKEYRPGDNATYIISYNVSKDYHNYTKIRTFNYEFQPGLPQHIVDILLNKDGTSKEARINLWKKNV
jgi:4-amino-4-deoxy-L-arabinose transferase-like glycosyltransferase